MRIAYYNPLPPQTSGIADYSAELLPHLAEHCEIELIVDEGVRPEAALAARFPVQRAGATRAGAGDRTTRLM